MVILGDFPEKIVHEVWVGVLHHDPWGKSGRHRFLLVFFILSDKRCRKLVKRSAVSLVWLLHRLRVLRTLLFFLHHSMMWYEFVLVYFYTVTICKNHGPHFPYQMPGTKTWILDLQEISIAFVEGFSWRIEYHRLQQCCGSLCYLVLDEGLKWWRDDTVDGRNPAPPGMYKTL